MAAPGGEPPEPLVIPIPPIAPTSISLSDVEIQIDLTRITDVTEQRVGNYTVYKLYFGSGTDYFFYKVNALNCALGLGSTEIEAGNPIQRVYWGHAFQSLNNAALRIDKRQFTTLCMDITRMERCGRSMPALLADNALAAYPGAYSILQNNILTFQPVLQGRMSLLPLAAYTNTREVEDEVQAPAEAPPGGAPYSVPVLVFEMGNHAVEVDLSSGSMIVAFGAVGGNEAGTMRCVITQESIGALKTHLGLP